jgi:hypothetical protein
MCYTPLYTPSVFMTCITWTQNKPRHDKVKINRANGQTGGKNCSSTFVLTAFISLGLFNVFHTWVISKPVVCRWNSCWLSAIELDFGDCLWLSRSGLLLRSPFFLVFQKVPTWLQEASTPQSNWRYFLKYYLKEVALICWKMQDIGYNLWVADEGQWL